VLFRSINKSNEFINVLMFKLKILKFKHSLVFENWSLKINYGLGFRP
jgi:hypothetical protein